MTCVRACEAVRVKFASGVKSMSSCCACSCSCSCCCCCSCLLLRSVAPLVARSFTSLHVVTFIYGQGRTIYSLQKKAQPITAETSTFHFQNMALLTDSTRIIVIFIVIAPQSDRQRFSSEFRWQNCLFNGNGIVVVGCRHAIAGCRHGQWHDAQRHSQRTGRAILECQPKKGHHYL